MKSKGVKMLSCTLAAGVLATSIPFAALAAPISGVVGMASTDTATVQENSYSTLSGVSLTMSRILAESTSTESQVQANDTATVEAGQAADQTAAQADAAAQTAEQQPAQSEFANIAIAQVNDYVNVRSGASEETEVVGKLYNNSAATVLGQEGDWLHISSGSVDGYVKAQYVAVGNEEVARAAGRIFATVTTQTLCVRSEPSTEASVLGMVPGDDDLTVVDESTAAQGWVKVSIDEGDGYVSTQYVTLSTEYKYAESKAEEEARLAREAAEREAAAEAARKSAAKRSASSKSSSSGKSYSAPSGSSGSSVANYACQFVGNPYVYGGTSLTNGADCSGFVMSVYRQYGVSLPHSSSALRSVGYGVSQSQMQPGDIVCYSGHVGIYIGNGQIVHASNARDGIKISSAYYKSILAVRRIF